MGFLFWLIGGCFSLFGLFCIFAAVTDFAIRNAIPETAHSKKYRLQCLLWAAMGVACQGIMVVFFRFKP